MKLQLPQIRINRLLVIT